MTFTYKSRRLGILPWPDRLGKSEYKKLELKLKALLGEDYYDDPDALRRALHTNPDCRALIHRELAKARWSADLLESVPRATELARDAPLLGRPLSSPWIDWSRQYEDEIPWSVMQWLRFPARMEKDARTKKDGIGDGRHRLTWLRLHHGPDYELLVVHDQG